MNDDLQKAKELLWQGEYTCVLCRGEEVFFSRRRGVAPLLDWLEENPRRDGFCAADKVVGRAAAFLYLLMEVRRLYAGVISQPALALLEREGIFCEYDRLVPAIRNRSGDGPCPMESVVLEENDPHKALGKIKRKYNLLQSK